MQVNKNDIIKLRKMTAAGFRDCKEALEASGGELDKAVEIIRKKGKAIAAKRAHKVAREGVVLTKLTENNQQGVMIVLLCETDFVAKNQEFLNLANIILNTAVKENPPDLESLKNIKVENNRTIADFVVEYMGKIGEKMELSFYDYITGAKVFSYIHPDNKLASMVAFNKETDSRIGKDIAMQIAAMNPIAIDNEDLPRDIIEKEKEIAREQARQEGKPEHILDKIAIGKLNKFFQEVCLLKQIFIKNNKIRVKDYLKQSDKDLKITSFKRYSLRD